MRTSWMLALFAVQACQRTSADPIAPPRLEGGAIADVVSDTNATWFLVSPKRVAWSGSVLCLLEHHRATCATAPGSAQGARLLEPDYGATPLVAIPDGENTLYLEAFTWRPIRRLVGVRFDQHGVVLRDRTMWIEERSAGTANLIVVPPDQQPRRWFATSVLDVFATPRSVVWSEGGGVLRAGIFKAELLAAEAYRDVRPWVPSQICRTGETIGLIEAERHDLVVLGSGTPARTHAGIGANVQCRSDAFVATRSAAFASPGPAAAWCSTDGVCGGAARGPFSLSVPPGTPFPEGTLDVINGELRAFDRDGLPRPVVVTWSGIPPIW